MSGFRVMVVTEQPTFRQMLVCLAQERGLEAFPAADGIDALRQIYHVQPHVIVSDAALPNLSGFELLPFVRRRFPQIGVLALRESQPAIEHALFIKADVILPSDPFNPALFADLLEGLAAEFPFRSQTGPLDETTATKPREPEYHNPAAICQDCEQLQRHAGMARMNALLARVWNRVHPENDDAAGKVTEAELAFNETLLQLQHHQRQVHARRARVEPLQPSSVSSEFSKARYANR
jgi:CheY-like chemotaxis protein